MKNIFGNGGVCVVGNGAPCLCLGGVQAVAQEMLDAHMLCYPPEEQSGLPAILVDCTDCRREERRAVNQHRRRLARLGILASGASRTPVASPRRAVAIKPQVWMAGHRQPRGRTARSTRDVQAWVTRVGLRRMLRLRPCVTSGRSSRRLHLAFKWRAHMIRCTPTSTLHRSRLTSIRSGTAFEWI